MSFNQRTIFKTDSDFELKSENFSQRCHTYPQIGPDC